MSPSQDLLARSRAAVWHPCTQMQRHETLPIVPIIRGEGSWLYGEQGARYLDAVSSWWVNLFGHNEPRIKAAISRQMDQLEHVMLAGFTHRPVVELSERLGALSGLGHAFYGSDGASATEIALKMSFHYWRNQGQPEKTRFVHLENSYHGETVGALAVTDIPLFRQTYAPLLLEGLSVPCPDNRHASTDINAEQLAEHAAQAVEQCFATQHQQIAAMIVEPLVQGAAGMAMYHPHYLRRIRELCDRYHVLLIADEIAVGFGRTGRFFAHQHAEITPDFLCLSKGITGGYLPLSVVLTTDAVYHAFYDPDVTRGFLHSHSYTGNPLACAAALAVLDIFEQDQVLQCNKQKAEAFTQQLQGLCDLPWVTHFRHCGMIWAFDVVCERNDFALAFFREMLEHECLVRPIGKTVYFMPPYCTTEADITHLYHATRASLAAVCGNQTTPTHTTVEPKMA